MASEDSIIEKLKNCSRTPYYIAKKTGLSNSSIANWLKGKTKPNSANIAILEHFFQQEELNNSDHVLQGPMERIIKSNELLAESNRILAESNKTLVSNNTRLLNIIEKTNIQ